MLFLRLSSFLPFQSLEFYRLSNHESLSLPPILTIIEAIFHTLPPAIMCKNGYTKGHENGLVAD